MNHTIGILFLMNHEALLNWLIRQFPTYIIFRECYFSTMKSNQKSPAYVKWAKSPKRLLIIFSENINALEYFLMLNTFYQTTH